MFYVSAINGSKISVTDTDDNAVDVYDKEELKRLMCDNPELIIKGVGVNYSNAGLSIAFKTYELSVADELRIKGARSANSKFMKGINEKTSRTHYFCYNCNKEIENKAVKCSCGALILWGGMGKQSNGFSSANGLTYNYMSVKGAKKMYLDRKLAM